MYKISTLLILFSLLLPFSIHADDVSLDISKGSISITNRGYTQTNGNSSSLPGESGRFIITQTDKGQATGNTITVSSGTHNITINGINIESNASAFSIASGAKVNLTLEGENNLQGAYNYAGLHVPGGDSPAELLITEKSSGALTAIGGYFGAGIGGGNGENGGTIIIDGGKVTANGGWGGEQVSVVVTVGVTVEPLR